jgi:hypothetical protein
MKSPKFAKVDVLEVEPKLEDEVAESDDMMKPKEEGEEEISPEMIAKILEMVNGK